MYIGPADVAFFHKYLPLPPERLDAYFHVAIEIRFRELVPDLVQLEVEPGLIGACGASHVRVRLPDGLEYEGEIKPRPVGPNLASLVFKLERFENTNVLVYREFHDVQSNLKALPSPSEAIRIQASKLQDAISGARSVGDLLCAAKRAEGFVLGLKTVRAVDPDAVENLNLVFTCAIQARQSELGE